MPAVRFQALPVSLLFGQTSDFYQNFQNPLSLLMSAFGNKSMSFVAVGRRPNPALVAGLVNIP